MSFKMCSCPIIFTKKSFPSIPTVSPETIFMLFVTVVPVSQDEISLLTVRIKVQLMYATVFHNALSEIVGYKSRHIYEKVPAISINCFIHCLSSLVVFITISFSRLLFELDKCMCLCYNVRFINENNCLIYLFIHGSCYFTWNII